MKIKGKVTLEIPTELPEDCEAMMKSLMPDEKDLPRGLSSRILCDGNRLIYELYYDVDSEELLSIYNTLDDLIRNVRIVSESLKQLRR